MKMRFSKSRFATILLICVAVLVIQIFLFPEGYTWRPRLTATLSGKWNGDMRISGNKTTTFAGIRTMSVKNSVASSVQRLHSVKEECGNKSWDSLSNVEKRILGRHILVDDKHRFLYCFVPKVACSNWKRVLMVLDGRANDTDAIQEVPHEAFTALSRFPPAAIKQKLREYYKFMFVREPLARLLSAYRDKFVLNNPYFHRMYGIHIVKHARKNASANSKGNDVKVEEFFQYVLNSRMEDMNEHWMPFYKLCQPCVVSYDFIGSMENLESDSNRVLKELNVDKQVSFPRHQSFYKPGGDGYVDSKKVPNIPPDMMGKVLKKFALDYKMFSYQMPNQ